MPPCVLFPEANQVSHAQPSSRRAAASKRWAFDTNSGIVSGGKEKGKSVGPDRDA